MQFNDTEYDDFYGVEGNEETVSDEFETGGSARFPTLQFAKGYKTPKLSDAGKVTTEQSHGFMFSEDQIPEDLKDVLKALVEDGDAVYFKVKHSAKQGSDEPNIIGHYQILQPKIFALAHATPWQDAIFDDVTKQKGLAAGYQTFLGKNKEGEPVYNRTKFLSVLVVEQHLYAAGYVDEMTGVPKPVRLSVLGYNADELYAVFSAHSNFIKAQRQWVFEQRRAQIVASLKEKQQPINAHAVETQAKQFVVKHVQLFAYAMLLGETDEPETHGEGQDSADVYEIRGKANAIYGDPEQAEKMLHCGDLYRSLASFVWDTSVRPAVVGGKAIEWCREECARWHENEEKLNPYRGKDKEKSLKLGKNKPQPAYLKLREHIDAASMLSRDAVEGYTGNGRAGLTAGGAGQPAADPKADAYIVWNKHKKTIEGAKDPEGLGIIVKAEKQIQGVMDRNGEIEPIEEARIISVASTHLAKCVRRLEIAKGPNHSDIPF